MPNPTNDNVGNGNGQAKKLLAVTFDTYILNVYTNVKPSQKRELKRAFFAGCWSMFTSLVKVAAHPEDAPTVRDVKDIDAIYQEIVQFRNDVMSGKE